MPPVATLLYEYVVKLFLPVVFDKDHDIFRTTLLSIYRTDLQFSFQTLLMFYKKIDE